VAWIVRPPETANTGTWSRGGVLAAARFTISSSMNSDGFTYGIEPGSLARRWSPLPFTSAITLSAFHSSVALWVGGALGGADAGRAVFSMR
jgi:hypothetical protein